MKTKTEKKKQIIIREKKSKWKLIQRMKIMIDSSITTDNLMSV